VTPPLKTLDTSSGSTSTSSHVFLSSSSGSSPAPLTALFIVAPLIGFLRVTASATAVPIVVIQVHLLLQLLPIQHPLQILNLGGKPAYHRTAYKIHKESHIRATDLAVAG
jgi:hypothetical protein